MTGSENYSFMGGVILSAFFGVVLSTSMIIVSLRYYVSIERPYFVLAGITLLFTVTRLLVIKYKWAEKPISYILFLTFFESCTFFIISILAMRGIMSIYPPNL